jgi:hypothetical protein
LLAEACGIRVLSDPWWRGPCFGAQWWIWPRPDLSALQAKPADFVYVSHGHHDHLHAGTLSTLEGSPTLLVAKSLDLLDGLREAVDFPIREVAEDETLDLGEGVTAGIWPTYGGDSLMWISDGSEVLVNANDALHSAPREIQDEYVKRLRDRFPRVDYFFCGFATASHFPNCYEVPGVDREETARQRQHYFNEQWLGLVAALAPRFAYPFAGDVAFFENDLFWLNAALHNDSHLDRRIREQFGGGSASAGGTVASRIGPGFSIEDGAVVQATDRPHFDPDSVREEFAEELARANRYGSMREGSLEELAGLLREKLGKFPKHFGSCPYDYEYTITFREGAGGIVVSKAHGRLVVRVVDGTPPRRLEVLTRGAYLRYALETRYGHEVLFVGSGIRFRYPSLEALRVPVHQEVMGLLRPISKDWERPAVGALSSVKRAVKEALRAVSGRSASPDLYDLDKWLVRKS